MVEEKIICIGCPLGCETTLMIDDQEGVVDITGYKCKEGRQYVLEEYRNPVCVLTATVLTEKSFRPLFPVRTNKPLLKMQIKEAAKALSKVKVKPPIRLGQIILSNIMNTGVDIIASDDLIS